MMFACPLDARTAEEQRALVLNAAATAFMFADADGNGELNFTELSVMMHRMNVAASPEATRAEVTQMFATVGLGSDADDQLTCAEGPTLSTPRRMAVSGAG